MNKILYILIKIFLNFIIIINNFIIIYKQNEISSIYRCVRTAIQINVQKNGKSNQCFWWNHYNFKYFNSHSCIWVFGQEIVYKREPKVINNIYKYPESLKGLLTAQFGFSMTKGGQLIDKPQYYVDVTVSHISNFLNFSEIPLHVCDDSNFDYSIRQNPIYSYLFSAWCFNSGNYSLSGNLATNKIDFFYIVFKRCMSDDSRPL